MTDGSLTFIDIIDVSGGWEAGQQDEHGFEVKESAKFSVCGLRT